MGLVFVTALALLLAGPPAAWAGEAYYLLMFGAQRIPNNPDDSHSFATFVRATWPGDGPCPGSPPCLEAHTISWLPRNLEVRTLALLPECGHNFGLHETLRHVLAYRSLSEIRRFDEGDVLADAEVLPGFACRSRTSCASSIGGLRNRGDAPGKGRQLPRRDRLSRAATRPRRRPGCRSASGGSGARWV